MTPAKSKARIWDRSLFNTAPAPHKGKDAVQFTGEQGFRTFDQHGFVVHPTGAFVRFDKDRRSVKERKAAKRAARAVRA